MQYLVAHRRRLVGDQTRISNRLTAQLKLYFPQVLDWFDDLATHLVCDFLMEWPTLSAVKKARRATLEKFFCEHNSVRQETNRRRIAEIKAAIPLTTDAAVINSSVLMVKALCAQMKTLLEAVRELEAEISRLCNSHEDHQIFESLPGAGPVYASRLTAVMGTNRERWSTPDEVAQLSGIAPVIEKSEQSSWVRWRYFCTKIMRQTFHEYAGESIKHSFWARAYYQVQRARGKSHHAAVRALAYKWIRIIFRCWQTRTPYSEVKYLESLRKKGSPLLKYAAEDRA